MDSTPRQCSALKLQYRLTGSGWAECDIVADGTLLKVTASYLSDALGQLATAALILRLGAAAARVSFDEEPGEYRWGFDWHRAKSLRMRIWWFDEMWSHRPDDDGKVVLDLIVEDAVFYNAILNTLDDVLKTHGVEGYKEAWVEYPFPKAVHEEPARMVNEWPGRK